MEERKETFGTFIKEELEREAEEIRKENEAEGEMVLPDELQDRISQGLQAQIDDYEWKKRYPNLTDEEIKAMRLGQELLKKENMGEAEKQAEPEEPEKKTVRKKRGIRFYLGLAAVFVLVLAIGVTSLGGAERVVRFVKSMVGEREVVQVDSGEDNMIIIEGDAEEAYQVIGDKLGIEPVRPLHGSVEGLVFNSMEFDEVLQLAELSYSFNNELIYYFINASYSESSWGIDVEDNVTDKYEIEKKDCLIKVTEYETPESKTKRYSASFQYKGLEYYLIGTVEKAEFEKIIENLYFII